LRGFPGVGNVEETINCGKEEVEVRLDISSKAAVRLVIVLVCVFSWMGAEARADILHQSATMGPSGQSYGWLVDTWDFIGSRFYIDRTAQVTAIGGHLTEGTTGNMFGAIVRIHNSTDFPDGEPFESGEVVASVVFDPGYPSSDYRVPLSVELAPGWYVLVFGSGWLGSTPGEGVMPDYGQTDLPGSSYIGWADDIWFDTGSLQARFVVEGYYLDPYCSASGYCDEYISGVQVGSINNTGTACSGYADYRAMSTTMKIGTGYPMTVTNGNPYAEDRCGIWIDWNQDKDFSDAGETITVNGSPGVGPYTATITPPAGAVLGSTRMRVKIEWNQVPQPCGTTGYGEVEDYTINVTPDVTPVTISGYVKTGGSVGIEGALVTASTGQTDTTDSGGYYELTFPSSTWSGTITPTKSSWTFSPPSRTHSNVSTNLSNQNFTGTFVQKYGGGSGTAGDPYLIYDANQMNQIGLNSGDWNKQFKLMADINLIAYTGTAFNSIGTSGSPFTGVFDGNGCEIRNFSYKTSGTSYVALFRCIGGSAVIKKLGLRDPNVDANGCDYVGSVAGQVNSGSVEDCYIWDGRVFGDSYVGGLVGDNRGTVTRSNSSAGVSGTFHVGGLVGINGGQISNSCSTGKGKISGFGMSLSGGGLVGYNTGQVSKCYSSRGASGFESTTAGGLIGSAGPGATTTDSFWDVNTGNHQSAGGTGKTTKEMQTAATFTAAGWDFVTPVWTICEGRDYPQLYRNYFKYGGGKGTVDDPYQIATPCQMQQIGAELGDWDKNFILVADINLSDYTGTQFNIIGSSSSPFTGVFDGNGHSISNFTRTISYEDYTGIFGYVSGAAAQIRDLDVVDVNVAISDGSSAGALVGQVDDGNVTGCRVKGGRITGGSVVGGLVGLCQGHIQQCSADVDVSAAAWAGGLVGYISSGWTVEQCFAGGTVSATEEIAGGLIGGNTGAIIDSYAVADANSAAQVGGLIGYNTGDVTHCYSTGSVTGESSIGGLIGNNESGTITDCFWDIETSGTGTSDGGTGKTTAQMKNESTFTGWDFGNTWKIYNGLTCPKLRWERYSGGEGTSEAPYWICHSWEMQTLGANSGDWDKHFKLMADLDLGGYTGTQFNLIGTWPKPFFVGTFDGNGHKIHNFTYKTDTVKSGVGLFGAAGSPYTQAEIKNLTLVEPNVDAGPGGDAGAIVGLWYQDGVLSGCAVIGGSIKGSSNVGGLIGWNQSCNIEKCCSLANVSGTAAGRAANPVGGLIGVNNWGVISECYSGGSVASDGNIVGGLAGWNGATVTNCYSTAVVSGVEMVGGLVGYNSSSECVISKCYAAGSVSGTGVYVAGLTPFASGALTDCFWDTQTSGRPEPAPGTGLPTEQMQMQSTFTDAGWDFIQETANGYKDVWRLCNEGSEYPKLAWEYMTGDFVCPDGVELNDLEEFAQQWLLKKLKADVDSDGGNRTVDFLDWVVFASAWQSTPGSSNWNENCDIAPLGGDDIVDVDDVVVFTQEWLQPGAYSADIWPRPDGDGIVDAKDFAVFAENWLEDVY